MVYEPPQFFFRLWWPVQWRRLAVAYGTQLLDYSGLVLAYFRELVSGNLVARSENQFVLVNGDGHSAGSQLL